MILEEIPLVPGLADQRLDITLAGRPFTMQVIWNERFKYFSYSLFERSGAPILLNVKMVNGFPLLKRFAVIDGVPGELYFVHRGGKNYRPEFEDLGVGYGLFYIDEELPLGLPVPLSPLV